MAEITISSNDLLLPLERSVVINEAINTVWCLVKYFIIKICWPIFMGLYSNLSGRGGLISWNLVEISATFRSFSPWQVSFFIFHNPGRQQGSRLHEDFSVEYPPLSILRGHFYN